MGPVKHSIALQHTQLTERRRSHLTLDGLRSIPLTIGNGVPAPRDRLEPHQRFCKWCSGSLLEGILQTVFDKCVHDGNNRIGFGGSQLSEIYPPNPLPVECFHIEVDLNFRMGYPHITPGQGQDVC